MKTARQAFNGAVALFTFAFGIAITEPIAKTIIIGLSSINFFLYLWDNKEG